MKQKPLSFRAKVLFIYTLIFLVFFLLSPTFAGYLGEAGKTESMAFGRGGPLSLGYDYLGRPLAPQLLLGGRSLILASTLTALSSQAAGLCLGIVLAFPKKANKILRFALDIFTVLPGVILTLVLYQVFSNSLYAIVPIACLLTLPLNSRYYSNLIRPLLSAAFYEQSLVMGNSQLKSLTQEILPILKDSYLTDFGLNFISAVYMLSTVSFLGVTSQTQDFVWSAILAQNLRGIALNPWGTLAPLLLIALLTVPLNFLIDELKD